MKKKYYARQNISFLRIFAQSTLLCISSTLLAIDNPHFYRATFFWGEPRLNRPWLTTFSAESATGSTRKAFNSDGEKTPLLNIYGPHVLRALGQGVPNLDPSNPLDAILINAALLPADGTFGTALFSGHFRFFETQFQLYQNFINGFFCQIHFPVRWLKVNKIRYTDLSPQEGPFNQLTPAWVALLTHLPQIADRYHLSLFGNERSGIGDLSLLGGWCTTNYSSCYLDFIDVSAKFGVLLPTAKKVQENHSFGLPLGYNGHIGVPLKFDLSIGYLEWLTFGTHIGALFLIENKQTIRMRTSEQQNGFIILTEGKAQVDPGTYWDMSVYAKADHLWQGWSFLLGYSYTQKDRDCVKPEDFMVFNPAIATTDPRFKGWNMHELHFSIGYDWNRCARESKPIVDFFYNMVVKGKNIFITNAKTLSIGLNIAWQI